MGIVEDTNMDRNNRRRTLGKNGGEGDPNEGECVGVGFFFLDDLRYIILKILITHSKNV
jgi:hypothetical protein